MEDLKTTEALAAGEPTTSDVYAECVECECDMNEPTIQQLADEEWKCPNCEADMELEPEEMAQLLVDLATNLLATQATLTKYQLKYGKLLEA